MKIHILEKYISELQEFRDSIDSEEKNYNYFYNSKKYRDSFVNKKVNGLTSPRLNVIIKDEKVALARVVNLLSVNDVNIKNIGIIHNREAVEGALELEFYNLGDQENGFKVLIQKGYEVNKIR